LTEKPEQHKCIAVVRIRGLVSASKEARETLEMLNLKHSNHAALVDDRPSYSGMLRAVRDYVTYGEPSKETVAILIEKKGRSAGDKRLTEEYAQKSGFKSLAELVEAVNTGRAEYWKLPNIQPYFRLHPPSKGYKGKIKRNYGSGGELGYRGDKIDDLLKRML
jgi:large subunit ribosomal protein L30